MIAEQSLLLPGHTYAHNSGGDPLEIPSLTWEGLKEFHSTFYHPSNAVFYTYGDIPVQEHLQRTGEVLRRFQRSEAKTQVPLQPRWGEARRERIDSPPDPMSPDASKQTVVASSYLLGPSCDVLNSRLLAVLSQLLISGPSSPFFRSLIEPNTGLSYSPGSGLSSSGRQSTFSIGLTGIRSADTESVISTIQSTLEKVLLPNGHTRDTDLIALLSQSFEEGFAEDRIDGIVHQMELSMKRDSENFGLSLMHSCITPFLHGAPLGDICRYQEHIDRIKACSEWRALLRDSFLDNPHRLTLVMEPSDTFQRERLEREEQLLAGRVGALSEQERQQLYE